MSGIKAGAIALAVQLAIVLGIVGIWAATSEKPAEAAPVVSCVPKNNKIVCTAGGVVVLTVPIPTIEVPGPTIEVPGATVTVKPPVQTVTIPGDTETVTVEVPGPTVTETVTKSPKPSELPTATQTETATAGQTSTPSGTVDPQPEQPEPDSKTITIIKKVGTGLLVSIVLALLGIAAMFLGYRWGFRDGEKNQEAEWSKWIRANVLDRR